MQDTYTLAEIASLIPGSELVAKSEAEPIHNYLYDTRQLITPEGTVFLALNGASRTGLAFVQAAYSKGVKNFMVPEIQHLPEANQLVVPDVLSALQALAAYHRKQFTGPVVGITGSNGKTIVKEWLAAVLEQGIYRSPRSYNSQLGVALSLLGLRQAHSLALIEAGISTAGEMEPLAAMIQPTLGILTHIGDAHASGFDSMEAKLSEKLKLFANVESLIVSADDELAVAALRNARIRTITVGKAEGADYYVSDYTNALRGSSFTLKHDNEIQNFTFAQAGEAALENILLVIACAHHLGVSLTALQQLIQALGPVSMRMEMITDNPEVTILNDSYTSDSASVLNALSLLASQQAHQNKRVVLTDVEGEGPELAALQQQHLEWALKLFGERNIELIGLRYSAMLAGRQLPKAYLSTDAFLADFTYSNYQNSTVLLKGSRRFALEGVIPALSRRPGETYFKISLNALEHNLETIRRRLPTGTRIMVMLKAAAYGAGSWQVAQVLSGRVAYLAVALTQEGIELRQRGVTTPIMVLNPDSASLAQLATYRLEPVVYSHKLLEALVRLDSTKLPIHLEFDTGMARLGFAAAEVPEVLQTLIASTHLTVASVFTHLAAAEDPAEDDFTEQQLDLFSRVIVQIKQHYPNSLAHTLNTGGILRHPGHAFDMVRLGIGLYGISPVPELQKELEEVGSLISSISQIHNYPAGTTVGYGRAERLTEAARIATIPIGYADGLPRRLGQRKLNLLVKGKPAPIVGRICMDMLMLDVTQIPEAAEGDEVVVFGAQGSAFQSVGVLATLAHTIAYEILAAISARVRRIYVRE